MNRLSWPPLRSDVIALICIGVVIFCPANNRWPGLAIFALAGAIFCAVSPRMQGQFGFSGSGVQIGGEFVDPFEEEERDSK
jgi:hypothetical protein